VGLGLALASFAVLTSLGWRIPAVVAAAALAGSRRACSAAEPYSTVGRRSTAESGTT